MRELLFDLTEDFYFPKSAFGGFEGEHNATLLTLRLPERLLAPDAVYYMVFETEKNDEVIFSAPLLPRENAICVPLPKQVMVAPRVTVHAAAYRKEGEELVKIAKSGRVVLEIKYPESEIQRELSQDGGKIPGLVIEEAVLPESENPVSSRALYDEITALEQEQLQSAYVNEAGELILKKKNRTQLSVGNVIGPQGEQGERGEQGPQGEQGVPDYSLVANALKGTARGLAVTMKDVSPFPHRMQVQLSAEAVLQENLHGDLISSAGDYVVTKISYDAAYDCQLAYLGNGGVVYDRSQADLDHISVGDVIRVENKGEEESGDCPFNFYLLKQIDFSAVTLTGYGKNLLSYPYHSTPANGNTVTEGGITYTDNGDGTITANGTATENSAFSFHLYTGNYTGDLVLSGVPGGGSFDTYYVNVDFYTQDKEWITAIHDTGNGARYTNLKNVSIYAYIRIKAGTTVNNLVFKPMLEVGSSATEYEPYKAKTYKPNADGVVEDVQSLYPVTTLMTDTDGVSIQAEYNRDLNQVIQRLESALIAIGGEV